jgi:hypothetical protein
MTGFSFECRAQHTPDQPSLPKQNTTVALMLTISQ